MTFLEELRRLSQNASPRPWSESVYEASPEFRAIGLHASICQETDMKLLASCGPAGDKQSETDIDFMVLLANHAEILADVVEAARNYVTLQKSWFAHWAGDGDEKSGELLEGSLDKLDAALYALEQENK